MQRLFTTWLPLLADGTGEGSEFDKWVSKTEQGSQVRVYGSSRYRSAQMVPL